MGEIGKMDRRIDITTPTTTKSGMGAPAKSFVHLRYAQASRELIGDSPESYVNNRLVVSKRYKYKIHICSDVDETMRITDDSEVFNILSVNETGLFIEMLVEKVVE